MGKTQKIIYIPKFLTYISLPHKITYIKQYNFIFKHLFYSIDNKIYNEMICGSYARLIIIYIFNQMVKTKSSSFTLKSISNIMKFFSLKISGGQNGSFTRFKKQFNLIFNLIISKTNNLHQKSCIWSLSLHNNNIVHIDTNCNIKRDMVPVDLNIILFLKNNTLALDMYFWLTYRRSYLKSELVLSFSKLQNQFMPFMNYSNVNYLSFKKQFIKNLYLIQTYYTDLTFLIVEEDFILIPGDPHIVKIKGNFIDKLYLNARNLVENLRK